MSRSALLCGALALAGCEPTVDGVCEDVADECGARASVLDIRECTEDGDWLSSRADDKDCNDEFDAYLDCVDEQLCAWDIACVESRTDLERCMNTGQRQTQ